MMIEQIITEEAKKGIIYGYDLYKNMPPEDTTLFHNNPFVIFEQDDGKKFGINDEIFSRNILSLGETGTGKTNVMSYAVKKLLDKVTEDDVVFIFDVKGEYAKNFFDNQNIKHKIFDNGKYRDYTIGWNIFRKILSEPCENSIKNRQIEEKEELWKMENAFMLAKEVSEDMFEGHENQSQPFFSNAAKDLLASIIIDLIGEAEYEGHWEHLTTELLKKRVQKANAEYFKKLIKESKVNGRLEGIENYFGKGDNLQALGVFGELQSCINKCLNDVFSVSNGPRGTFAGREAVFDKGAYVYFIEFDLSLCDTLSPMYRLLLDLILKAALTNKYEQKGNVYIILDELSVIPQLKTLEKALNLGRSLGIKIWASLQSVSQLYKTYDEQEARALLAGFTNLFVFKSLDQESRKLVAERTGKSYTHIHYRVLTEPYDVQRESNVIEDWDILSLKRGHAIVALADEEPFIFQFPLYAELLSESELESTS